jgi:dUTPase
MKKRTEKRYYKVGEKVWVREEKAIGEVKALNIKPEQGVYEAVVEIVRKNGDTTTITTKTYKLWEIDKDKRTLYKQKRKAKKVSTVLFSKVRETAIIPTKDDENGGYDIYADIANPVENPKGKIIKDPVVIPPQHVELIPTGIASSLLPKYRFILKERGSTGVNCMAVRAGVIDSGFRDEWFVVLNNTGNKTIIITHQVDKVKETDQEIYYPASKAIAQATLQIVPKVNTKEIPYEQLKNIPSKRGTGKLGSSNK